MRHSSHSNQTTDQALDPTSHLEQTRNIRQRCITGFLFCVFISAAMTCLAEEPKALPALRGDGITVYTAPWCGPCSVYKRSVLNPLKAKGYRIKYVDYDSLGPKDWKPNAIPCTVFFRGKTQLDKPLYGILPISLIRQRITLPPPPKNRGPIIFNATRQILR